MDLEGIEVVKDNVIHEDLLDFIRGPACDGGDGAVVQGQYGNGLAMVDLFSELGLAEKVVESAIFRVLSEHLGDVESGRGGGGQGQEEECNNEEEGGFGSHIY